MGCSCCNKKEEEKNELVQNDEIKKENMIYKNDIKNIFTVNLNENNIDKNNSNKFIDVEIKSDKNNDFIINNNIKEDFDYNFHKNNIKKNIFGKNNNEINVADKIIADGINSLEKINEDKKNEDKIMNDMNNIDESFNDKIFDELKFPDSELEKVEYLSNKNYQIFFLVFGKDFKEKYLQFSKSFIVFNNISFDIKTTFYTLSFGKVKNIIENLLGTNKIILPFISPQFYFLLVNNAKKLIHFKCFEDIFEDNNELSKIMIEIQVEIIKYIIMYYFIFLKVFKKENITFSFIKYLQDIGFCIKFFFYAIHEFLLGDEFIGYEYHHDIRILYFLELEPSLSSESKFPKDLLNLATESLRIKDTIILGEKQFKNHIKSLNIQKQRIHELDEYILDSFFKKPFKENNKYKITKYFVICEEKDEKVYLEKFKSLSHKYGFAYLFLVYIKSKQLSDLRINLNIFNSVIYIFSDFELLECFKDNNERLKPNLQKFLPENDNKILKFTNELVEKYAYKDIKDFKSNCEDGWELFEFEKDNNFVLQINFASYQDFVDQVFRSVIQSYKEHNSLEIFFKYYINYFCINLQPEIMVNMTSYAKMFLYAYTLEEKDLHKNLYSILNDDLRSSNPSRINRHFDIIKLIGGLINIKELKSYTGKVYRATYLKDVLIKKIKIGLTITNSAFWSSTKKESIALKFLKKNNYKNGLIIAEGCSNNNVDIHLEEISRYPKEEEVLFLPFCKFKIKSFGKVNENGLSYYKLVLEKESDSSIIKPFDKNIIESLNFGNKI